MAEEILRDNTCLFSEGVLAGIFFIFWGFLSTQTLCSLVQNQGFTCSVFTLHLTKFELPCK